jgi:flagellar biosynthesis protein FliR
MNGSNVVLVFAPLAILLVLMPVFEASTFPNIIKGGVIGLYCAISIIGVLKMLEELRS